MSCSIALPSDESVDRTADDISRDSDTEDDDVDAQIKYVIGDVTKPHVTGTNPAVIVHCLGKT